MSFVDLEYTMLDVTMSPVKSTQQLVEYYIILSKDLRKLTLIYLYCLFDR